MTNNTHYSTENVEALIRDLRPQAEEIEQSFETGIVVYSAGFVGTWACQYLKSLSVNVTHILDRDPAKTGKIIHGVSTVLPEPELLSKVPAMLIAARSAVKEVQEDVKPYGFPAMSFEGYFVTKNYERLADIRDNYLDDAQSVDTFNALMTTILTDDLSGCRDAMIKDMYFCLPEFSGNFDETFVDAGAFVGDSVERFIWENLGTFRHVYAFEPGYKQFVAMEKRVERLAEEWAFSRDSISLVKAGLSSSAGRMRCTYVDDSPIRHGLSDSNSILSDDDERLSSAVCTLDDYLEGKPVSFIKADVEGMEMPLLLGAQQTIKRHKPKMALCVYHYPSDLYEIPEFVRSLVPEYKFRLRQHAPILGDYVLYCHVET